MKRKIKFEDNVDLLRKIAWSFHHSTGIELDELFAEASLAYCEALHTYNPKRGKITTYLWITVRDRLRNYVKKHYEFYNPVISVEEINIDRPITFSFMFESLSTEAQQIAEIVLKNSFEFVVLNSLEAKTRTRKLLIKKGWTWQRIACGLHDLTLAFK